MAIFDLREMKRRRGVWEVDWCALKERDWERKNFCGKKIRTMKREK
jgi:hypothetical protein